MKQRTAAIQSANVRAFTLIELMIVVVIMGVLAALSIQGYSRYIQHTKTTEAREVILSISAGQSAYHSEVGRYLDVTGGLGAANFYPDAGFDGTIGVQWGGSDGCSAGGNDCIDNFNTLGVVVDSKVLFRYASTTEDCDAGDIVPDGGRADLFNPSNLRFAQDGFVTQAATNLNGDPNGELTVLMGWSEQAEIFINENND